VAPTAPANHQDFGSKSNSNSKVKKISHQSIHFQVGSGRTTAAAGVGNSVNTTNTAVNNRPKSQMSIINS
jgi:hypothetical protein